MSTPIPNYVNPPTQPPGPQIVATLFTVLVFIALVLRLYTRAYITISFGLDDVFVIAGTACAISVFIISIIATNSYGWNRHIWDIPPDMYRKGEELNFVYDVMFSQAACQTKLSLLWFSRRLIGVASAGFFRAHYVALIVMIAVVALCQVLFIIISFLECRPLKAVWDPNPDYAYTCFNINYFLLITGLINTVTDFCCTLLPAIIVMKLQMPLRRKIAVASMFLVGITVNISSALRIYYAVVQAKTGDTWDYGAPTIAANFEIGLGLLCVNAPTMRPLLTHYTNYLKSYTRTRGNTSAGAKYLSASQSGRIPESDKLADSNLDNCQAKQSSVVTAASSKALKAFEGIEVTRTVELDTLHQESSSNSVDEQRNTDSGSQEDILTGNRHEFGR